MNEEWRKASSIWSRMSHSYEEMYLGASSQDVAFCALEDLSDQSSRTTTSPWLMNSEGQERYGWDVLWGGCFSRGYSQLEEFPQSLCHQQKSTWAWLRHNVQGGHAKGKLSRSIISCHSPSAGHIKAQLWPVPSFISVTLFLTLKTSCTLSWSVHKWENLDGCKRGWQDLLLDTKW